MTTNKFKTGHPVCYQFQQEIYGSRETTWRNVVDYRLGRSRNMYRKNLSSHYGCVNAIEFSKDGTQLASGGDDRRILLWNVQKIHSGIDKPIIMQAEHLSNIFCLSFDNNTTKIFSAGNDDFVIIHDIATGAPLDYFMHEQPVFGISVNPLNDNIFTSACDDGRMLVFDTREPSSSEPFCLAKLSSAFHSVMFNPVEPRLIVSANSKEGIGLWDIRVPKKPLLRYGGKNADQCCMSARFNSNGTRILALRRRLPPVLYATDSTSHLFNFNHKGYYNSCTMKSCTFAGSDDQYIMSGSDNFDLFMWKIPTDESNKWVDKAHMVLKGHRSIVNQVRYNKAHPLIASSGVEKIVKLWSPFPISSTLSNGSLLSDVTYEKERQIYTHDEYIDLIMQSGQFMSLTFDTATRKNTREDPRMMAFFDALVQRDINGLSDESEDCTRETSYTNLIFSPVHSSSDSSNDDGDSQNSNSPTNSPGSERPSAESSQIIPQQESNNTYSIDDNRPNDAEDRDRPTISGASWILSAVHTRRQSASVSQTIMETNPFPGSGSSSESISEESNNLREYVSKTKKRKIKKSTELKDNMLTKLIMQRENHLRRLARLRVMWEEKQKRKKGLLKSKMRSTSSDSLSSATLKTAITKIAKVKPKYVPLGKSEDSSDNSIGNLKNKLDQHFYRRKYSTSPPKKKSKRDSLKRALYYGDTKLGNGNQNACNYWKTKSAVCNSSTFDVQQPSTSASVNKKIKASPSSSSDSSSTSSSSDSSSSANEKSVVGRKRKIDSAVLRKKADAKDSSSNGSESSSTEDSDSSDTRDVKKKSSVSYKMYLSVRQKGVQRRRRRINVKKFDKKVNDLDKSSVDSSSSSIHSPDSYESDTSEDKPPKRFEKKKVVAKKKEIKGKSKPSTKIRTPTVVTTDSGVEIEKSVINQEPQPCCSKSVVNSSKSTNIVKGEGKGKNTSPPDDEGTSSDDESVMVPFRKRIVNRKRQYRHAKKFSD